MPFTAIAHNTSGNNSIVAARAGSKIRVIAGNLSGAGTVLARFEDAADSSTYLASYNFLDGQNTVSPYIPNDEGGCFETSAGNALNLELSAAVFVYGFIRWEYVGPGS